LPYTVFQKSVDCLILHNLKKPEPITFVFLVCNILIILASRYNYSFVSNIMLTWFTLQLFQRRSARFVKGDYRTTFSVSQMLHDLGWCDLKDRRRDLRLALLYKIVTGHVAINPDQISLVAAENRTRANHRYKFRAIGASLTGLRYSFAVRTVRYWNHRLPAVVVEQENPAAFKAQLARCAPVSCMP